MRRRLFTALLAAPSYGRGGTRAGPRGADGAPWVPISVTGMVLKVDRSRNTFTASIQAIPGFMPAMAMPFEVRRSRTLTAWYRAPPSSSCWSSAEVVVCRAHSYRPLPKRGTGSAGGQPPEAADADRRRAPRQALAIGETVPDFRLTNQKHRPVALSQLRGKVVAINFIYTSCPLPNFCLRIANNFGVLQKRSRRNSAAISSS